MVQQPKSIYQNAFGNSSAMGSGSLIGKQSIIGNGENMGNGQMAQNAKHFGFIPSTNRNLFSRDYYKCDCGYEVPPRDLKTHYDSCFQMSSKFSGLFFCLNHEITQCRGETQSLKNLKLIMTSFIDQINDKIKINNIPSGLASHRGSNQVPLDQFQMSANFQQPIHSLAPQRHQSSNNSLGDYNQQQKQEIIFDNSDVDAVMHVKQDIGGRQSEFKQQKKSSFLYDEEDKQPDIDFHEESVIQEDNCSYCNIQFTSQELNEGQKQFIQSTECFHPIHVKCMVDLVFEKFPTTQTAPCPFDGCNKAIQEFEFKQYLKQEQINKLDELVSKAILNQGLNVVVCKCGNVMELEEGKLDLNQKDDSGKKISREAAVHMAKYRVRCTCGKNFCSQCKEEPYHLGKTCEQLQELKNSRKCRYCATKIDKKIPLQSQKPAFKDVCNSQECLELMRGSCDKLLKCGHFCGGFANEKKCLPCLHPDCVKEHPELTFDQNADSYCAICYSSGLGEMPCVRLDCGHIFHVECIKSILSRRWPGPRVVFGYLNCTSCKRKMSTQYCPEIQKILNEANKYEDDLKKKAIERGKHEGLDKHENMKDPNYAYYNKFQDYCLFKLAYYECFKCHMPYFGGMKDCQNNQEEGKQNEVFKKEDLVCAKCSAVGVGGGVLDCPKHGTDYIEFKCKFCCNTAQWFCWGNTHFCESCHKRQNEGDYVSRKKRSELPKCPGVDRCPIKIKHPENGEEFPLGCALCRNMKDNMKNF